MSCINLPTVLPGSPSKTRGQIQVILGPMFSGKSTELMRRVRRFQIAQYKCLVIKYAKDTRYSSNFSTHDRNTMEALPACLLRDVAQEALGVAVIGIDEGQFFPDIVEFSESMANEGKTVIVAALDGTFQRKAFGSILNLVPLAESVVKLTAVCMECFREAAYTKRLGVEKEVAPSCLLHGVGVGVGGCRTPTQSRCVVSRGQVEVIGGADKYHSVCRLCYFKKALGQPTGLDSKENKENCPVLGKPGEAKPKEVMGARKLFAPHQILQCSSSN
ncbi:thymidine kinase, cytosolic isoform X1 [Hippopotamus amphibius kiboko]|uniref:thymidine kinase, cytosolic isoform X1 n=1 Tax=Hippopotamus amphibius kiboko TaxID=575201 RepID=UPI002594124D|nr:thymidine kinase, cytosolic isoform X1 [Hippopotamus amphibius kiboko]